LSSSEELQKYPAQTQAGIDALEEILVDIDKRQWSLPSEEGFPPKERN
jgi:hypothetical protein